MPSIRDVARVAGVSTATVSNVLNGRSGRVSPATTDKVLLAVRSLKYRPTPLESKQKAILTQNVGFIVTDMTAEAFRNGGYFSDIMSGALEGLASRGYSLTIFVEKIWDDVGLAIRRSYDGRCDGVIMVAPQPGNTPLEMLYARGTPIVLVGSTPWLSGVSSVDIDNVLTGALAAKHLFELGHRRLAMVLDPRPQVSTIERQQGFLAEAERLGISCRDLFTIQTPHLNDGPTELKDLAAQIGRLRPTGIFCWHDGLAARLWPYLEERGFRIPEDLSVVAVDDAPEGRPLGLTTFKNPTYELGRRAAKVLVDKIADPHDTAETVRFAPEMLVKASTSAPSV